MEYDKPSKRLFAAWYDLLNSGVESRVTPYRRLTAGLSLGRTLEIGAGTGANIPFYPPGIQLIAVEPNPHMIRRFTAASQKSDSRAVVVSGVGERLPFAADSFDSVVTTLTLCMVKDLDSVVAEIRRVLRPGGQFLFYEHVVSRDRRVGRLQSLANPLWKFATTGCNLDRDIVAAIRQAGFHDIELRRFSLSVGLPITIPNIVGVARAIPL